LMPVRVSLLVVLVSLIKAPLPLITPERVWAALELYSNVALLVIVCEYEPEPSDPVPPICTVPILMVVAPVYVFTPLRVKTLAAVSLIEAPLPLMTPERVWLALELYWNVPLSAIVPA